MVKVLVKKLDPAVQIPSYKTIGASGMDLMAFIKEPIKLPAKKSCLVPTGISIAMADDYEIQIRPRSGLALKYGITIPNSPGTIDPDYRGVLGVLIRNEGSKPITIRRGDRIAQLVFQKFSTPEIIESQQLEVTDRGEDGFGSTGIS